MLGEPTDFLGLASTGSGKTAAFGIPLLEKIDSKLRAVQSIILCPTRELALQVAGQIDLLGKYMGIKSIAIYGGASYGDQIRGIKHGAQVVVGTPGRVIDHLEKGTLKLDQVKIVVLDEADEMISMGFKEDIESILEKVEDESSKIWLFSATMSSAIRSIAHDFLTNPQKIEVNRAEMLPSTIEQIFYMTRESDKPEVLCKLVDAAEDFYGLVFCQTKSLVVDLAQYLSERGYKVDTLHGDKSQDARERSMKLFRERKVRLLICTDVAARGLDVKDITHVINYSLPRELDNYVHRIGRTARSGKKGIAMCLVTPSHFNLVERIERMTKSRMTRGRIPARSEISAKKIANYLNRFTEVQGADRVAEMLDDSWKAALETMTATEVAAKFLVQMFPDVLQVDPVRTETRPHQTKKPYDRGGPKDYKRSPPPRAGGFSRDDRGRDERPREGGTRFSKPRFEKPRFEKPRFDRPDRPRDEAPREERAERPVAAAASSKPRFEKPRFGGKDKPRHKRSAGGFGPPRRQNSDFAR